MTRRKAWNGMPPKTRDEARRRLLDVARECIERMGIAKASLSDVATGAGVTRQTVYRYFEDVDDLFNSAAALSSGGFYQRIHAKVAGQPTVQTRIIEWMVQAIREIPKDPHLGPLMTSGQIFTVGASLKLRFVQEETLRLGGGELGLSEAELDGLAEVLLRLLHSFLFDPGEPRTEAELRAFLARWLTPLMSN